MNVHVFVRIYDVLRTFVHATKIRLCENLTSEIFYWQKYPDLWYKAEISAGIKFSPPELGVCIGDVATFTTLTISIVDGNGRP